MATPIHHPQVGDIEIVRNPTTLVGVSNKVRRHAPTAGEHSAEILAEFGISDSEIKQLILEDVV
jgi:crotonobetainyl-CoA:carnitine CoA-transferase CaiB-like acyl-CoA transferase